MQVTVSSQGREGDGVPKAIILLSQAAAYLGQEAADSMIPGFQQLPLYQKVALNLLVTIVPVAMGITGATVVSHQMEKGRVNQRRR